MKSPANSRERPHARLYAHWRDYPAWKYLSPAARSLLIEILMDYRPGKNGYLRWSLRRAAEAANIGKASAATALEELEACGWITCERIGGLGRGKGGSEYALTMFHNDRTGHLPTHAFERWELSAHVIRARRSSVNVRPEGHSCPVRGTHLSGQRDTSRPWQGLPHVSEGLKNTRIGKELAEMAVKASNRRRKPDTEI